MIPVLAAAEKNTRSAVEEPFNLQEISFCPVLYVYEEQTELSFSCV